MAHFIYKATTIEGGTDYGYGMHSNAETLEQELKKRDAELVGFLELPPLIGRIIADLSPALKPSDISELCHHVSTYVSSGLDIQSALNDLAETQKNNRFKRIIHTLRDHLLDGYLPSQSFEQIDEIPELIVNMARIGEQAGNLEVTLKDAANHIDKVEAIKAATKRALIYPLFTIAAMSGGFIFWMAFVVPKIADLFVTLDAELPMATQAMIAISAFVQEAWFWLLLVFLMIPAMIKLAMKKPQLKLLVHKLAWHSPVIGPIIAGSQQAYYFQYLCLMYGSGIPITTALQTVEQNSSNTYFREQIGSVNESVRSGATLAQSFAEVTLFDPIVKRMIGIGEQTGSFDTQLKHLAETYMSKVESLVEVIGKLLEPLIMGLVALMFAFFAVAMIGPLYDLMSNIGG